MCIDPFWVLLRAVLNMYLALDQIDVIPVLLYTWVCHVQFREILTPDILENLATMRKWSNKRHLSSTRLISILQFVINAPFFQAPVIELTAPTGGI